MAITFRKLRALMFERGIKKYDLRKAGVNSQILDKVLLNGNVDTRTIDKLCKILNCQPGDIMEYEDLEYWETPEGMAELADQPYGRWATVTEGIKPVGKPSPEQQKAIDEVKAELAAKRASEGKQ